MRERTLFYSFREYYDSAGSRFNTLFSSAKNHSISDLVGDKRNFTWKRKQWPTNCDYFFYQQGFEDIVKYILNRAESLLDPP